MLVVNQLLWRIVGSSLPFVRSKTVATGTPDGSITIPASTVIGDMLYLNYINESLTDTEPSGFSGWTPRANVSAIDHRVRVYTKPVTSSGDIGGVVSWSGSPGTGVRVVLLVLANVSSTVEGVTTAADNVVATHSTVAATPSVDGAFAIASFSADASASPDSDYFTRPTDWSEEEDGWSSVGGRWLSHGIFSLRVNPAASTSATTTGDTSQESANIQMFFLPARATVTISTPPSRTKISRVAGGGMDSTSFGFTSDKAFQAYQIRVVPSTSSSVTAGVLVEQATGLSVAANSEQTATITDDELVAAEGGVVEGDKTIKVFVQDTSGFWSL